jgi:hypothetical protein
MTFFPAAKSFRSAGIGLIDFFSKNDEVTGGDSNII